MKLISVYLEYIAVSEYTHEQNSLVKRNCLNLIYEKKGKKSVVSKGDKKGITQILVSPSLKQIE